MQLTEKQLSQGLNQCDKCKIIIQTENLVWITAEDFKPMPNESISKKTYDKYDALCVFCYYSEANITQ